MKEPLPRYVIKELNKVKSNSLSGRCLIKSEKSLKPTRRILSALFGSKVSNQI